MTRQESKTDWYRRHTKEVNVRRRSAYVIHKAEHCALQKAKREELNLLASQGEKRICAKCGAEKLVNTFAPGAAKCGSCKATLAKTRYYTKGRKLGIGHKLGTYKAGARLRGLNIELDDQAMLTMFRQPCFYCGIAAGVKFNGIDRLDSTLGYIESNVVTACSTCNMGKQRLTKEQFINWICQVHTHLVASGQTGDRL